METFFIQLAKAVVSGLMMGALVMDLWTSRESLATWLASLVIGFAPLALALYVMKRLRSLAASQPTATPPD